MSLVVLTKSSSQVEKATGRSTKRLRPHEDPFSLSRGRIAPRFRFSAFLSFIALGLSAVGSMALMARASASAEATFEQEVHFNFTPGLTGELELNHPDLHIERVRALLTVDDQLMVIPMQSLGGGRFRGVFPTPSKQLRYQYQFFRDNHEASVSDRFSVDQSCGPDRAARGSIAEAIELDQDIERLRASEKLVAGIRGIQ